MLWRSPCTARMPRRLGELLARAFVSAALVLLTYQFDWRWLRFLTSEAVLRASDSLGMIADRVSFDTIRIHGESFRFVIACTFIDVLMGAIPLLWNLRLPISKNILRLTIASLTLLTFNLVRLEFGHLLHAAGAPWILSDEVLGGLAYFVVWLAIWHSPPYRQTSAAD